MVRDILRKVGRRLEGEYRVQNTAFDALQEAAEGYLVQLFTDSYLATLHCGRVTLSFKDIQLARRIRGVAKEALRN